MVPFEDRDPEKNVQDIVDSGTECYSIKKSNRIRIPALIA
ncbi:hypothetical protein DOY81_010446 [Sarcophaga bullata]|nr:hypothetical protein DOY81_010446 [Sarcophaga bullata]